MAHVAFDGRAGGGVGRGKRVGGAVGGVEVAAKEFAVVGEVELPGGGGERGAAMGVDKLRIEKGLFGVGEEPVSKDRSEGHDEHARDGVRSYAALVVYHCGEVDDGGLVTLHKTVHGWLCEEVHGEFVFRLEVFGYPFVEGDEVVVLFGIGHAGEALVGEVAGLYAQFIVDSGDVVEEFSLVVVGLLVIDVVVDGADVEVAWAVE